MPNKRVKLAGAAKWRGRTVSSLRRTALLAPAGLALAA